MYGQGTRTLTTMHAHAHQACKHSHARARTRTHTRPRTCTCIEAASTACAYACAKGSEISLLRSCNILLTSQFAQTEQWDLREGSPKPPPFLLGLRW